jgi:hypothetical protein
MQSMTRDSKGRFVKKPASIAQESFARLDALRVEIIREREVDAAVREGFIRRAAELGWSYDSYLSKYHPLMSSDISSATRHILAAWREQQHA